jgi:hypothetical protein
MELQDGRRDLTDQRRRQRVVRQYAASKSGKAMRPAPRVESDFVVMARISQLACSGQRKA